MVPLTLFCVLCLGICFASLASQAKYREARFKELIREELGLSGVAGGPSLSLQYFWQGVGRSRALYVKYTVPLGSDRTSGLTLQREVSNQRRGTREFLTGDIDFDDYFWIPSADLEYLTPERRSALIQLFMALPQDASIERGRLQATVHCAPSPWGLKAVVRELQRAQLVPEFLENPPPLVEGEDAGKGWVAREQTRNAGLSFLALAVTLFVVVLGCAMSYPLKGLTTGTALLGLVAVTGLTMAVCGAAYLRNSPAALPLARAAQILSFSTISTTLLMLFTVLRDPFVPVFATGFAVWICYYLHVGYLLLSRLRLG